MATPGMSRPRDATSVATRIPLFDGSARSVRARNLSRVSSRTVCPLPLWIARHQTFILCSTISCSISSHRYFWPAKTIMVSPGPSSFLMIFFSSPILSSSSMTFTTCFTLAFTVSLSPSSAWPMRTCTASLDVSFLAAACTSRGQVAVKKSVCRAVPAPLAPPASLGSPVSGQNATIFLMSGSKPMSSMRSASSSTRYVTAFTLMEGARPLCWSPPAKSSNRPGVAMSTSAPCRNSAS
mmetsp:Transcript_21957/g.51219  ORF Transcript_21957/g.51219 Transcript_21957/m.51219 type:complete len:238 (+) Transcript_21957:446-1159(+)